MSEIREDAERELDVKVLQAAKDNHIWLNAFSCICPTDEFKLDLANTILRWLDTKALLLPASPSRLGELTPMLYLSINKS